MRTLDLLRFTLTYSDYVPFNAREHLTRFDSLQYTLITFLLMLADNGFGLIRFDYIPCNVLEVSYIGGYKYNVVFCFAYSHIIIHMLLFLSTSFLIILHMFY